MDQPINDSISLPSPSPVHSQITYESTQRLELPTENIEKKSANKFMHSNNKRFVVQNGEHYKTCTKILFLICIVLVICILIIDISFLIEKRETYCETDKCVRTAALLKFSMNLSADPCQDFFEYTCGRWSEEHPMPPDYGKYTKLTETANRVNFAAQKFLSMEDAKDDILTVRQSRMFYRSCLHTKISRSTGFSTIFEYLKKCELPIVPRILTNDSVCGDTFDWLRTEAKLKRIYQINAILSLQVLPNRHNKSENVIYIGGPKVNCKILRKKKLRETSKKILRYVVSQIIQNATDETPPVKSLEEAVNVIENFKKSMCEALNATTLSKAPFHPSYKFQDLQDEIDKHLFHKVNRTEHKFLKTYVGYIFDGIMGVKIDFQQDLLYIRGVKDKLNILNILAFMFTLPETHIEFYLWWTVVVYLARDTHLGRVMRKIEAPHKILRREYSKRTLELICSREVSMYMPYAVAYGIAEKNFRNSTAQKVKVMVEQLKDEFRDVIQTIDWLDVETRRANLEKLDYIHQFIGVPDWLFQKGQLDKYYRQIEISSDTFLRNKLQIWEMSATKTFERFKKEKEELAMFPKNPLVVNAYNLHLINSIVFPLAILAFPIFDLGLEVLNYGSLGPLLGHELIHGFDTSGLHFDKLGNYLNWWSRKSEEVLEKKSRCFKQQYNNLTLKGVKGHVSGVRTINENIADNGGMNIAYSAYKKYENIHVKEGKLPGFENFTKDQLFFIAFGNVWCGTSTSKQAEWALKNDHHSPGLVRVNIVMQNSPQFAEIFNCPEGSMMNPSKKCKIW